MGGVVHWQLAAGVRPRLAARGRGVAGVDMPLPVGLPIDTINCLFNYSTDARIYTHMHVAHASESLSDWLSESDESCAC